MAHIELTQAPYLSSEYPDGDYEREGLAWMEEQGLLIRGKSPLEFWAGWKAERTPLWVVRFKLVEVLDE